METLKRPRDFDRVFQGARASGPELVVYALPPRRSRPGRRVGFCVTRKVRTAVLRNRLRRRLRELYRRHHERLNPRCDLILMALLGAERASFSDLEKTFLALAARVGILREPLVPPS